MLSFITAGIGFIAATYLFLSLFLRLTQDPKEPPLLATALPFVSPLISMAREKSRFHKRMRDDHRLPIYTLRLPFQRMYIVNTTRLIPLLQKQWRLVSFAAIAANAGRSVGMSKEATDIMHHDLASEHGFSVSWPRYILPAIGPGKGLDAMNRRAVEVLADEINKLQAKGPARVGLSQWSRATMVTATTEAVWGPQNPYRDPDVVEAWRIFEAGFLTFSMFPFAATLFPKLLKAREIIAAAFIAYMRKGGRKSASSLVHMRYEHHHDKFGLDDDDVARGEIGNTFAVLSNTTPCALWLIYHIFSDAEVLTNVRSELESLVYKEQDEEGAIIHRVDLAAIRSCPILLSTFQEMMRFRAVNPGPRILLEDLYLDDKYLLKKGSMLMIPATVQHSDIAAWGEDANTFDYLRFTRKTNKGQKRPNRVAFRAFGGGHILCPGRHFASTELMAYAALLVLQFDIVPVAGRWIEPICDNSPAQAGFPIPDTDIEIELRPRDSAIKWKVSFTGSDESMVIVSEDAAEGQ